MKRCYKKLKPEIIRYRDYGYDSNERFKETVISELSKVVIENNDKSFNRFLSICRETLNTYTPLKKRYIRGSHSPFMNKMLNKQIMKRARLRNKFLRNKSD